jgi:hypothetical protein
VETCWNTAANRNNSEKAILFCIACTVEDWEKYLRACSVFKKFQDSPSHRILRHMHGALNIDENKN